MIELEGANLKTAKARGTKAVTIPFLQWHEAELTRETPPLELADAFGEIMGSAFAGFVASTPREGGTIEEALEHLLSEARRIALERLAEVSG
jgi:hypothetical protein